MKFIFFFILLGLAIFGFVTVAQEIQWFSRPSFSGTIIIFLGLTTIVLYRFTVRKLDYRPEDFVKIYLGTTVLRILFFGGFIFTLILLNPPEAHGNALLFLVSYFLFTALEVGVLFRQVNSKKP